MPLELELEEQYSEDFATLYVVDKTPAYSEARPGGYGGPNPVRGSVSLFLTVRKLYKGSYEDVVPEAYIPSTVGTWQLPNAGDGQYDYTVSVVGASYGSHLEAPGDLNGGDYPQYTLTRLNRSGLDYRILRMTKVVLDTMETKNPDDDARDERALQRLEWCGRVACSEWAAGHRAEALGYLAAGHDLDLQVYGVR